MKRTPASPRPRLAAIEERVSEARSALQEISDRHPAFESRIRALMRLMALRDRVLANRAFQKSLFSTVISVPHRSSDRPVCNLPSTRTPTR